MQRPLWTGVLATINIVGSGIGYLIPSLIVEEDADRKKADHQFMILMIMECAISLAGALLVIFLFREAPPTPPRYKTDKVAMPQTLRRSVSTNPSACSSKTKTSCSYCLHFHS